MINPMGTYRVALSAISTDLMFNIMTTNKNRIAIAPTYTIKKRILKNSTPNNNIKIEALAKATTKKNTECIGFFALTTKKPEIKAPDPKIQNKASDINIDFLECLRGVEPPHLPSEVECTAIMLQTSFFRIRHP